MNIIIKKTNEEASAVVAEIFRDQIKNKPNSVLGLATGSTPLLVYANLINMYKASEISFKDIKTYNLDEYIGLEPTHEQSYKYFMNANLFDHVDIDKNNCHIPSEHMTNPVQSNGFTVYKDYDDLIEKNGGIDLQILGIGANGHIGFNEPNEVCDYTHIAPLAETTIQANARFFDKIEDVPREAVSMGIKTIYNAKKIVLLATGSAKAQAVKAMLNEVVSDACPATLVRDHSDITIVVDEAAAALLDK